MNALCAFSLGLVSIGISFVNFRNLILQENSFRENDFFVY